ncbi:MAG: hypothetical protein J6V65_00305 [Fibrobacterales bacterium]|nr:hypothetical protein [Fibrobacterales bacterium]
MRTAKDALRHRKVVAAMAVFGAAVGVAVALLMTPRYESTSRWLPSKNDQMASQFSSLSSMFGLSLNMNSSPLDNIPQLLASPLFLDTLTKIRWRTVDTNVARTLDEIYPIEVETSPKAPHITEEMLRADALREIVLEMVSYQNLGQVKELTVAAPDPYLAHDVNEFLLGYVDSYINSERQTSGKHQLAFIENQLEEYNRELKKSENALFRFRKQNRVQSVDPEVQLEQNRLERELRINESVVAELRKQLENAKIDAEREIEVIEVFQAPDLPIWPVRPKKKLIAVAGFVGGCALGMALSLLLCWWKRNGEELRARLKEV